MRTIKSLKKGAILLIAVVAMLSTSLFSVRAAVEETNIKTDLDIFNSAQYKESENVLGTYSVKLPLVESAYIEINDQYIGYLLLGLIVALIATKILHKYNQIGSITEVISLALIVGTISGFCLLIFITRQTQAKVKFNFVWDFTNEYSTTTENTEDKTPEFNASCVTCKKSTSNNQTIITHNNYLYLPSNSQITDIEKFYIKPEGTDINFQVSTDKKNWYYQTSDKQFKLAADSESNELEKLNTTFLEDFRDLAGNKIFLRLYLKSSEFALPEIENIVIKYTEVVSQNSSIADSDIPSDVLGVADSTTPQTEDQNILVEDELEKLKAEANTLPSERFWYEFDSKAKVIKLTTLLYNPTNQNKQINFEGLLPKEFTFEVLLDSAETTIEYNAELNRHTSKFSVLLPPNQYVTKTIKLHNQWQIAKEEINYYKGLVENFENKFLGSNVEIAAIPYINDTKYRIDKINFQSDQTYANPEEAVLGYRTSRQEIDQIANNLVMLERLEGGIQNPIYPAVTMISVGAILLELIYLAYYLYNRKKQKWLLDGAFCKVNLNELQLLNEVMN